MKRVKLYGHLGKKFGRSFLFDVKTPYDAIQLLKANFKDFAKYMSDNSEPGYYVIAGRESVDLDAIANPISSHEVIKIIPVVSGAEKNPFLNVILGAALIAFAVINPLGFGLAGGVLSSASVGSAALSLVGNIGWALAIGGISQLLMSPSKKESKSSESSSYVFNGPANTTQQGNPVAIGYGRLRIGSQVISAGLFAEPAPLT